MLEAMDAEELKEYARENKDVLTTEMNAAIRKVCTLYISTTHLLVAT
jgi:hypothetical protein